MRINSKSPDKFIQQLNQQNDTISQTYLKNIQNLTYTVPTQVMLGDSTITQQETFDPKLVSDFYHNVIKNLKQWTIQDISITNNEDVRRIFTKFEILVDNYLLSGHMSIQFHVLLYYKPQQRVIDSQKELAELIDKTQDQETQLAQLGDQFVLDKLKAAGYNKLDHQSLFELFYENEELREKIYQGIDEKKSNDFSKSSERKTKLLNELDSYLIETYQTTPVIIDEQKLIAGEEGCLCTFDLEFLKDGLKEGLFDPKRISDKTKDKIMEKLSEFTKCL